MSITSNANSTFLNVDNAHLRVAGDIHATSVKVGAIEIVPGYSLESTTGIGNTTPHTVEFKNTETSLVTSGDINMLHSSNNAAIKLNSNVVTEFPRSKKLIKYPSVALMSASQDGYVVTASSERVEVSPDSSEAWHAFDMSFDKSNNDHLWTNSTSSNYGGANNTYIGAVNLGSGAVDGEWIKLRLPQRIKVEYMKFYNKDQDSTRIPKDFKLYGSNDNTNWTQLHDVTEQPTLFENTFNVNAVAFYEYIALVVTRISGQPDYFRVLELEYYGIPEYDPEAAGVDVKITSYPNVPNTDWLEVYYDAKDFSGAPSSITDKSGNNITATANNITIDATYNSFEFTQSPKSNIIADNVTFVSGDESHSIVLWVRLKNGNANNLLFDYRVAGGTSTTGAATGLYILNSNKRLQFYHQGTDKVVDLDFEQNRWYHITGTYGGGGGFTGSKIYIDGVDVGGAMGGVNSPLVLPTTGTITIGDFLYNNTYGLGDGSIANVRLFNRALTSDEIWQLYAYQKEYFGHGDLSMTLKAGRLGIGTSEPRAALDVRGSVRINDTELTNPVYAEFATNYSTAGLTDEQTTGWRDPSDNILDFNVVTQQSSHNAFDPVGSASVVRGSFTVPVDGVYVVYYAALVNRVSTSAHIYVYVNGSNANGISINSHQNRNGVSSMWTTINIQRVLRLKRGDNVRCQITGGFYTLGHYGFGSIYQIGA